MPVTTDYVPLKHLSSLSDGIPEGRQLLSSGTTISLYMVCQMRASKEWSRLLYFVPCWWKLPAQQPTGALTLFTMGFSWMKDNWPQAISRCYLTDPASFYTECLWSTSMWTYKIAKKQGVYISRSNSSEHLPRTVIFAEPGFSSPEWIGVDEWNKKWHPQHILLLYWY